jgi:hypothetical protein
MRRLVCSPSVISSSLENSGSAIAFHQTAISTIKVGIPTERAPSTMPGAIGFGAEGSNRASAALPPICHGDSTIRLHIQ